MSQPAEPANQREQVLALLAAHERPLLRYAWRLVRDEHAARDIVQHVFLKLCEQPIEELAHAGPWLYRVCRNKAMDILRVNGRRSMDDTSACAALCDGSNTPAQLAEQRDLQSCVRRLIQQFNLEQQELLQLWSNGLRFKEIAAVTQRSEVGVRVAIYRLLEQLRQDTRVQSLLSGEIPRVEEAHHESV